MSEPTVDSLSSNDIDQINQVVLLRAKLPNIAIQCCKFHVLHIYLAAFFGEQLVQDLKR